MSSRPRMMLVSDRRRCASDLVELVQAAARAGVDDVQVREKDLDGRDLLALVRAVQAAVRGTAVRVFVNGRPDVAQAAGAAGVQLPEEGLPVAETKRAFPSLVVGASRHSVQGVVEAATAGADLVLLGPIFATPGKEARVLGVETLRRAVGAVSAPVYAIGGVSAQNAAEVRAAGAAGLALLRPFLERPARETMAAFEAALW
jgi:thiamine-phosphate pyrophosphorylase